MTAKDNSISRSNKKEIENAKYDSPLQTTDNQGNASSVGVSGHAHSSGVENNAMT